MSDDFFFTLAFSHISPAKLFFVGACKRKKGRGGQSGDHLYLREEAKNCAECTDAGRSRVHRCREVPGAQRPGGAGCTNICYMEVYGSYCKQLE